MLKNKYSILLQISLLKVWKMQEKQVEVRSVRQGARKSSIGMLSVALPSFDC